MNFRKVLFLTLLAPALFTPGANAVLGTARFDHTSTLLPDGNILLTGGRTGTNTVTPSVEMYDMSSNLYAPWSSNLVTARSSHTATLMSDGRVLIAGGFNASGQPIPLATSLEICDPRSNARTCASAGISALTLRAGHTATLLSKGPRAGLVLLCGGQSEANGATGTGNTATCETFNPAGPEVLGAGTMVSPRIGHAAVLLGSGRVFVTGGRLWNPALGGADKWVYEPMNEMFDPEGDAGAGSWTPVSALLQGRISHTATVLNNGKIMIAGGYNKANYRYCQAADPDSLEDECWHINYDPLNTQDAGNHGFLDGAEFFDQNGARVVLSEETYGEIPYRVSENTAALEPDGRWRIHGGYGGIVPTFFSNSPTLNAETTVYLTVGANAHTGIITPATTIVKFPLTYQLVRPVSGRLVDADSFISGPPDPTSPSFVIDSAEFYLPKSTAPLDGMAVGMLLGDSYTPGAFMNVVKLKDPTGRAVFKKETVLSGQTPNKTYTTAASALNVLVDIFPTKTGGVSGDITTSVKLTLPSTYRSIVGNARFLGGNLMDNGGNYSIVFKEGNTGGGAFDIATEPVCEDNTCIFTGNITFTGVTGDMTNLTSLDGGTTYYINNPGNGSPFNPLPLTNDEIVISLELDYIARTVSALDREPTYNFDRSTTVIRGMVFSSQLAYSPDNNQWADLSDKQLSPTMGLPYFNHTALLTPAADTAIQGGRNCEDNPTVQCIRTAPVFTADADPTTFIPIFRSAGGSLDWPEGESLLTKRAFHTSTLLADGRILTCGGSDGVQPLKSCELMDPVTKKWTATAKMTSPRANHTATLLPNGNVLAVGGITPSGIAVNSAEIFYAETRRWVPTSSMVNARQLHTATLMPDGNVLVTGGATLNTYSNSAEIYITSAAAWANGGNLVTGRSQHTATLLKNGNVLIAGGVTSLGATNLAEVYRYLTRTSAATGAMTFGRYAHTATQLRDGNVIVIGGSNNLESMRTMEVFNGATWSLPTDETGGVILLKYNRSNHRSLLMPNGKIMITGGEMRGTAQPAPETYDPDFRSCNIQGAAQGRTHHTSVMTRDNMVINVGGWSGNQYLNSTEYADFNFSPDMNGLEAETTRQAVVSTGTYLFAYNTRVTLLSDASNFHGITEASGGGAGSANASYHNPRIYLQQIDNPSGFMVDLSTRIYSWYGGPNTDWEQTLSSLTIITPDLPGVMPYGWYHMRVAAAGVFSDGLPVQVAGPRPTGTPTVPTGTTQGTSSITWTWEQGTVTAADGYSVYSATDNVFIATTAFLNGASAFYTQTNLVPNTAASIRVAAYNLGGDGSFSKSATYYTLAAVPTPLRVVSASFETATLEWSRNSNSPLTTFEVSLSPVIATKFSDALVISTPVPFSVNLMSTSTVITSLSPNQEYDFRVRAMNGAGIPTVFTNYVSTLTVSGITNFTGQAMSSSTINWSWDKVEGTDTSYELYDISLGTGAAAVPIGTSPGTVPNISQTGLLANRRYTAEVSAIKTTTYGPIRGPRAIAQGVFTLTVQPLPAVPNVFTSVDTGTVIVNWITNGNSTWTVYGVKLSSTVELGTYNTSLSSMPFRTLTPNVRYYASVTPINGDGIAGTAVDLGSKYTLAKVPASLAIVEKSMSGILLGWNTGDNSAQTIYELRSSTGLTPILETLAEPIRTHNYFSEMLTDNYAFANGLLTSTAYHFDVAACNGEGVALGCTGTGVTARKRSVPVTTQAGPAGAPSGSIGGTSDPSKAVTISGTLPNGRYISMDIPAGSFPSVTAIAISSFSPTDGTNRCGYLPGGFPVEVGVFSEAGSGQPQMPITLTLRYDKDPGIGTITSDASKLVLARFNPVSGECLPLETKVNVGLRTITATLNHFSLFQVMVRNAAPDLNNVLIYPNPFYTNRGQGFVTIDKVPASSKLRIYTLSGEKVWEDTAGTTGVIIWKGLNKSGYQVASGIYLAVIDSTAGKKVFKLAVLR